MKIPVYSYRDAKSGFGTPVCDQNDVTATRGFAFAINNRDGIMGFAPSHFDLYKIGEFDTEKGTLKSMTPTLVVSGSSVFNSK